MRNERSQHRSNAVHPQSAIRNPQSFHSFAIIPAAGLSTRMGEHKLLMPWGESTVIAHVLAAWRASRATRVVAVVRADDRQLAEACRAAGVDVVLPDSPPPEMKVSVRLGLEHVERVFHPSPSDVWLLAPADMPRLSPRVIDRLLDEYDCHRPSILVPSVGRRRGHPVLFPWSLAGDIQTLGPLEGINALVRRHGAREIQYTDAAILDDLDTRDDYRRLQNG